VEFFQAALRLRTKTHVSITLATHWHRGYGSLKAFVQKRLRPAPESLLGAAMAVKE
jgi:hypothetical protein